MSQAGSKPKLMPLRMSELLPELMAMQKAEEDELDSCGGSPDRDFLNQEIGHHDIAQLQSQNEPAYSNDAEKRAHSNVRSYNQTYPGSECKQETSSAKPRVHTTPLKTLHPRRPGSSTRPVFKIVTPRSSGKKQTPLRLRMKGISTSKSNAKRFTPMKKCPMFGEDFKTRSKCSLFTGASHQTIPSKMSSETDGNTSGIQALGSHSIDEIFATPLTKTDSIHRNKERNVNHTDELNYSGNYEKHHGKFPSKYPDNIPLTNSIKSCREEVVTPLKHGNGEKSLLFETPSTQNSSIKHIVNRTPLYPVKQQNERVFSKDVAKNDLNADLYNVSNKENDPTKGQCYERTPFAKNPMNNEVQKVANKKDIQELCGLNIANAKYNEYNQASLQMKNQRISDIKITDQKPTLDVQNCVSNHLPSSGNYNHDSNIPRSTQVHGSNQNLNSNSKVSPEIQNILPSHLQSSEHFVLNGNQQRRPQIVHSQSVDSNLKATFEIPGRLTEQNSNVNKHETWRLVHSQSSDVNTKISPENHNKLPEHYQSSESYNSNANQQKHSQNFDLNSKLSVEHHNRLPEQYQSVNNYHFNQQNSKLSPELQTRIPDHYQSSENYNSNLSQNRNPIDASSNISPEIQNRLPEHYKSSENHNSNFNQPRNSQNCDLNSKVSPEMQNRLPEHYKSSENYNSNLNQGKYPIDSNSKISPDLQTRIPDGIQNSADNFNQPRYSKLSLNKDSQSKNLVQQRNPCSSQNVFKNPEVPRMAQQEYGSEKACPGNLRQEDYRPDGQMGNVEQRMRQARQFHTLVVKGKKFTVLGTLGTGGSSKVYKVMDPVDSSMYAIKCVNLDVDMTLAREYINEIRLLQRLQGSDKVITMFTSECVERERKLYVVMEIGEVDLSTLMKSYWARDCRLSLPMLVYYWTEMLAAVHHIHQNGIIHSDLKPANFLLVQGRLKLIDFGIASSISKDATSVLRNCTTGTFNYISPEAVMGSQGGRAPIKITYKSDVWSLGCILYGMLYGRTPFSQFTHLMGKMAALCNPHQVIDYPELNDVPPVILDTLKWCLTHDVPRRPSVEQLLQVPYIIRESVPISSSDSSTNTFISNLTSVRATLTDGESKVLFNKLNTVLLETKSASLIPQSTH